MKVTSSREAVMNVPCTGEFNITVCEDGFWEVRLEHNDGEIYYRSRGTLVHPGALLDYSTMTTFELPEWMWDAINAKKEELTIMLERNSLDAPEMKGVVV
jgi:hypothetical protein